jgi:hypothetical protein
LLNSVGSIQLYIRCAVTVIDGTFEHSELLCGETWHAYLIVSHRMWEAINACGILIGKPIWRQCYWSLTLRWVLWRRGVNGWNWLRIVPKGGLCEPSGSATGACYYSMIIRAGNM